MAAKLGPVKATLTTDDVGLEEEVNPLEEYLTFTVMRNLLERIVSTYALLTWWQLFSWHILFFREQLWSGVEFMNCDLLHLDKRKITFNTFGQRMTYVTYTLMW